ncbi:Cu-processing system permease protein [Paracoccus halophilus]|uniref:Cu-processing system permease protein n=1 Tax=Paracoccus halophilus TaxID=376733 RepID=A0A099F272_9RHOB|nr:ABC transporter permease subunit [Paracoccus halophilus]KGJ04363.1 membrane protein [Paracoccus halophilus]SFA55097.1 Cu-processing system permease protein [Paracoccus halophilus]
MPNPQPAILTIARRELAEGMRNRWVVSTTLIMAALALTIAALGSAPTGTTSTAALDVVVVGLSSLTIFLVPLIALLLSHDAITREVERGTLLLLLSHPLSRPQVIAGKFLGQLVIMALATVIGFGLAALFVIWRDGAAGWQAFAMMIWASILLGAVFLALGTLASASVQESSTAAGIAIGLWLLFVAIYDMALLAALVARGGHAVAGWVMDLALVLNPTDAYRLLTLGEGSSAMLSGMGGVYDSSQLTPGLLTGALLLWSAVPLVLAMAAFSKRNL